MAESGRSWFATTHWSMVVAAGRGGSAGARQALEALCRAYWYPLYACVRRRGHPADEAQDLTQEFFATLLEKGWVRAADPGRGRFRSFLRASLDHFLANQWDRARAEKRGGGRKILPLSLDEAERRYSVEPACALSAEELFEKRWAMTVLEQALGELRQQYADEGKAEVFGRLKDYLGGSDSLVPYRQAAEELGMTEAAVKMAVQRLRRRYRHILRRQIAQTVASPGEVEDEIRHLFVALGAG